MPIQVQDVLQEHWMGTCRLAFCLNSVNWASYSTSTVLCLFPVNGGLDYDPAGLFCTSCLRF